MLVCLQELQKCFQNILQLLFYFEEIKSVTIESSNCSTKQQLKLVATNKIFQNPFKV